MAIPEAAGGLPPFVGGGGTVCLGGLPLSLTIFRVAIGTLTISRSDHKNAVGKIQTVGEVCEITLTVSTTPRLKEVEKKIEED